MTEFFEVGVTGSQLVGGPHGVKVHQLKRAVDLIAQLHAEHGAVRVHEGDCIGVDAQLTRMLLQWRITWNAEETLRVCGHPPTVDAKRAHVKVDEEMPPDEYLARDRHIVIHGKHLLIAIPKELAYQQRGSGTWYTARHATQRRRPVKFVMPNGQTLDGKDVPMLTRRERLGHA